MSATAGTGVDAIKRTRLDEVALGMTLLGLIVSSILYGISLTQAYKYFHRFKKDPLSIKFLVTAVIVLNTASVFLVGHASWYYLVTKAPRRISVWSLNVELALSMVISGISETFLAFRVWKLSGKNYLLTGILLTFALLHFVSGEVSAVQFLLLKSFAKFGSAKVPSILRLTSAALCDTGIAVSLSYFLQQKRTGFKRSDEVIDYLIIFSINSGLLTSVSSIACLITYLVVPRTWVYLALCFLISRLYANTFLCSLNSRQILRNSETSEVIAPGVSAFRPRRIRSVLRRSDGEKTPTQIDVYVVTETISDGPQLMSSEPKIIADSHQKSLENHSDSSSSLGESATSSFSNQ